MRALDEVVVVRWNSTEKLIESSLERNIRREGGKEKEQEKQGDEMNKGRRRRRRFEEEI